MPRVTPPPPPDDTPATVFDDAKLRVARAAASLRLKQAGARLAVPSRMLALRLDVPGGAVRAWRCVYDNARGPGLGPLIADPRLDADQLSASALINTLCCALMDVPFGGAAGGVATGEVSRELAWAWSTACPPDEDIDIFSPGRGVPAQVIGWMLTAHRRHAPAAFSGKPPALGGIPGRATALGRGAYLTLRAYAQRAHLKRGATVAFFGDCPGASTMAALLSQAGYRVIPPSRLPPATDEDDIPRPSSAAAEADVLVVAQSRALRRENAQHLAANLIIELATGGVAAELDPIFMDRALPVLPDLLVRGGEALVAHLEWSVGKGAAQPDLEAVNNHLAARMSSVFGSVWKVAGAEGRSARAAATAIALRRLAAAWAARGG